MESEEVVEEYNTSEVDWGEETDQGCWDDGDDHTEGHWYIDSNPEYVPDDEQEYQEVEPEPTDQYLTCYGPKSQRNYEDRSDGEFYAQACQRRMKTTVAAPSRYYHGNQSSHVQSKQWNHNGNQLRQNRLDTPTMQFSGHKEGPSAYLRWEGDMEQCQLDADRIYFNDPAYTWKEVKMVMYTEFVKRAQHTQKVSTKRAVRPQVLQPANKRQSSKPVHTPQIKRNQGTTMEIKEQEPILAAEEMPTLDKVISELNVIDPTYQNTGMMYLHSVRNVDEGLGMEDPRPEAHQPEEYEQYTLDTYSPADHALKMTNTKPEVMQCTLVSKNYELVHYWNNFLASHSFRHSVLNDSTSSIMHLIFSLSAKEETGTLGVNKDQEQHKEDVVQFATTSEQTNVSDHLIQSVYHDSKNVITHLICPEDLGKGKLVLRTKHFEKGENNEDLKSVAGPPAHKINHTSYIGASSDIGASKEGYLCDHENFGRETTSYRFSTQPEHAATGFTPKGVVV
ncbi:hypothetical protein DY000_02041588 [Brassica cretica]|uniref:Uncharacterized protein n=1 Tax=Brassica cretica TaxID=69181 RepID=A0ABQ7BCC8_BRACR|nr:hypothetical protein DY000_02041588 [Brassica cretica]